MKLKSPQVSQNFSSVNSRDLKFQVGLKIPRKHYGKNVLTFLITFQFKILQKQVAGMVKNFLKLFQPKYLIQRQRKLKKFLFN